MHTWYIYSTLPFLILWGKIKGLFKDISIVKALMGDEQLY